MEFLLRLEQTGILHINYGYNFVRDKNNETGLNKKKQVDITSKPVKKE